MGPPMLVAAKAPTFSPGGATACCTRSITRSRNGPTEPAPTAYPAPASPAGPKNTLTARMTDTARARPPRILARRSQHSCTRFRCERTSFAVHALDRRRGPPCRTRWGLKGIRTSSRVVAGRCCDLDLWTRSRRYTMRRPSTRPCRRTISSLDRVSSSTTILSVRRQPSPVPPRLVCSRRRLDPRIVPSYPTTICSMPFTILLCTYPLRAVLMAVSIKPSRPDTVCMKSSSMDRPLV